MILMWICLMSTKLYSHHSKAHVMLTISRTIFYFFKKNNVKITGKQYTYISVEYIENIFQVKFFFVNILQDFLLG